MSLCEGVQSGWASSLKVTCMDGTGAGPDSPGKLCEEVLNTQKATVSTASTFPTRTHGCDLLTGRGHRQAGDRRPAQCAEHTWTFITRWAAQPIPGAHQPLFPAPLPSASRLRSQGNREGGHVASRPGLPPTRAWLDAAAWSRAPPWPLLPHRVGQGPPFILTGFDT